jgi:regulator of RNase E activity RraA
LSFLKNNMKKLVIFLILSGLFCPWYLIAQTIPKDELIFLTSDWKGERFSDGRPKIPDSLINRAKSISIDDAWQILFEEGYTNQFAGNWKMVHDNVRVVGRALTALYMPIRPDVEKNILERGQREGRVGRHLHWPINMLTKGDVYVANNEGRIGSLMGDNLANVIYKNSGNGVIFDGFARDLEGLSNIKGFNAFVRGFSPQFLSGVILMGLNTPITIGPAIVLPGDLVIADRTGVLFIPANMAEKVIATAEFIDIKDRFSHAMIGKGKYSAGQLDAQWTNEVREDFLKWLNNQPNERKISRAQLDEFMLKRTW